MMPLCLVPCACCASPAHTIISVRLGTGAPRLPMCSARCAGIVVRTANGTRTWHPTWLPTTGDLNAVKRGKVGKRVGRRIAGKATGRGMGRLFR